MFRYQVKCLDALRERLGTLDGEGRERVRAALAGTGGWEILTG